MTKIAIIEDDPVISQMYRMKFEAVGFEVQTADNGKDGISLAEQFSPDIILLDIQMPIMNGKEALTEIRSHKWGENIPVLVLTNLGEEEASKDMKTLHVESFIVKADFTPSQVVERIKSTLGLTN